MAQENSKSRQRLVRVPIQADNWLQEKARQKRRQDPDSRAGVATEINRLIDEAYEREQPKS